MTQRRSLVSPYLLLQIGMFLTVVAMAIVVLVATARAETTTKVVKKTTTTTSSDLDTLYDDGESEEYPVANAKAPVESELSASFGSTATTGYAGCKTEELAKTAVKELKADCNAWIKDQKTDTLQRGIQSVAS